MAWLAGKEKMKLYEKFEEVLRTEQTNRDFPGVPMRDLKKIN